MMIRAVVFDIGGVPEIIPDTGWQAKWEQRLTLTLEEIDERIISMGKDGSRGTCTDESFYTGKAEANGRLQGKRRLLAIERFMEA